MSDAPRGSRERCGSPGGAGNGLVTASSRRWTRGGRLKGMRPVRSAGASGSSPAGGSTATSVRPAWISSPASSARSSPASERDALHERPIARTRVGHGGRAVGGDREHQVLRRKGRVVDRDRRLTADAVHARRERYSAAGLGPADDDQLRDCGHCRWRKRVAAEADLVSVAKRELGERRLGRELLAVPARGGSSVEPELVRERVQQLARGRVGHVLDAHVLLRAVRSDCDEPELVDTGARRRGHQPLIPVPPRIDALPSS